MEKNVILNADILDIIFDGRNKLYGAYELRKTYNKRLSKAIFITVVLVLFAFVGTVFSGMTDKSLKDEMEVSDLQLGDVKKNDVPLPPPPPLPKPIPPPEPNQIRFTPPVIVNDDLVNDDEKIKEIDEDQAISTRTVESEIKTQVIQAPVDEIGTGIIEAPSLNKEEEVFNKVEIEASFAGGLQAWSRYLKKNLDANAPVNNGAPAGTYRVIVKFIVSKDGSISDVMAESNYGFGMEEEALKIIRRSPKWVPALQNGQLVNAYRRQPVTFIVEEN